MCRYLLTAQKLMRRLLLQQCRLLPQIAPSHVDWETTVLFTQRSCKQFCLLLKQAYQSQESKFMIFSDSLSALQALGKLKTDHPLLIQIQEFLHKINADQKENLFWQLTQRAQMRMVRARHLPRQPLQSYASWHLEGLVSWCSEPSQPQKITSGLNTNFNLSLGYSFHMSWYESFLLKPQIKFYPKFRNAKPEKNNTTCFGAYLYSASTQHGNLYPTGRPILFCGPTQESVLATANTRKTRERFWKKYRWMDRKGRKGRN